jgi:uncharacterized membrane protein
LYNFSSILYNIFCVEADTFAIEFDINLKLKIMNLKRLFGFVLTVLGIVGLIYAAVLFSGTQGSERDIKGLIIYGVLGIVFFMSGIGLVKNTKDEA